MLRIGDFSKIAKVSVRMLRYYDQIGLLKPTYIDTNSGYRNYSVDQLSRLNRIIFLKDIGFSLNEVMELVDETISIEEMKGMLLKRKQQLEHEISMAQINLSTVMDRLSSIEKEREIPRYDVIIKSTEVFFVAALREVVPHIREMGIYCYSMYHKLHKELARCKVAAIGPEVTFYYNDEYCETDLDVEASLIIEGNPAEINKLKGSELRIRKVEAQEKIASLIYRGAFQGLEAPIIELLKWTGLNGWETVGALREIHLSGPAHKMEDCVQQPAVVELQIPVKRFSSQSSCLLDSDIM
jgi:DNA-binding transcriptional MerR regulator/effector-binding domain-containing protein